MSDCLENGNNLNSVDETCPAVGYQFATICVPVKVTPFAHAGATKTHCCGEPIIVDDKIECKGKVNTSCEFTISQTICVEVPVEFGATATVGEAVVECGDVDTKDICENCKK
jgi:hypothetical protein